MGALFEEITKAGVMLDIAGLTPTSEGTRITWTGGTLSSTDGPFTVVGGYAILQAKDKAEAVEWTKRRSIRTNGPSPPRSARSQSPDPGRPWSTRMRAHLMGVEAASAPIDRSKGVQNRKARALGNHEQ